MLGTCVVLTGRARRAFGCRRMPARSSTVTVVVVVTAAARICRNAPRSRGPVHAKQLRRPRPNSPISRCVCARVCLSLRDINVCPDRICCLSVTFATGGSNMSCVKIRRVRRSIDLQQLPPESQRHVLVRGCPDIAVSSLYQPHTQKGKTSIFSNTS